MTAVGAEPALRKAAWLQNGGSRESAYGRRGWFVRSHIPVSAAIQPRFAALQRDATRHPTAMCISSACIPALA